MILLFIMAGLFMESCYESDDDENQSEVSFEYVGGQKCVSCHSDEYAEWQTSDHFMAMLPADDSTVLGSFNEDTLLADGILSIFYRKNGAFYIRTEGASGETEEFRISFIFGHYPLQQYLVEFPGGRMQAMRQTWDTDQKKWFHQYPGDIISPHDWLHWTNGAQTWNSMCADCHSTDLKKNYSFESNSFHTTWSEINVSCESCHGPGSRHIQLVSSSTSGNSYNISEHFMVDLSDTNHVRQVEVCAPCHARRSELGGTRMLSGNLFDNYIPEIISTQHYHPDGQIQDENYVYGSFVQSKMYQHNVRCTNCHNPHSGKLKLEGNLLCHQCHDASYSAPTHHFHKQNTEQAQCTSCHMPSKYYMVNDLRHDHSFRVPRPDQSVRYGTPNTCNSCHSDKSHQWAADAIREWYGDQRAYHFSDDLVPGSSLRENSGEYLTHLLAGDSVPDIAKATAIYYLSLLAEDDLSGLFLDHVNHRSPAVRIQALRALQNYPYSYWMNSCLDQLRDESRAVRVTAYELYAAVPLNDLPSKYAADLQSCKKEFGQYMSHQLDFPLGRAAMGLHLQRQGKTKTSITFYEAALKLDSLQTGIRTNLAMAYSANGENLKAEDALLHELKLNPQDGSSAYNLALLYVETGDTSKALNYFKIASETFDRNHRVYYNYGLLLQSTGDFESAFNAFMTGLQIQPMDHDLNYILFLHWLNKNELKKAKKYLENLVAIDPQNTEYRNALKQMNDKIPG